MSGYVLKVIREAAGLTQEQLAEHLAVDIATVQAWESGRRALMAIPTGTYLGLRHALLGLKVTPRLLVQLDIALEADRFLGYVLTVDARDTRTHPLASWVITRSFTDLAAWPFTKQTPAALASIRRATRKRGPVASGPVLAAEESRHVFDHLKAVAERANVDQAQGLLLRRQAHYVAGFDSADETVEWLTAMQHREERRVHRADEWTPGWAVIRSGAHALARFGDREALPHFIRASLGNDVCETANLNYWAYWLGELAEPQLMDTFMIEPQSWQGSRLLNHLISKLYATNPNVDVVAHTLWALLMSRPALADQCGDRLADVVSRVLEEGGISDQSRRELEEVFYALRMTRRR
ncbi:helix-turn-helix domain-containing protein [Streptosporangiaceae bacterium NEAU-GS5]|nr:helix-turn-helix domain-containing protein [Streptosporangiaceae bacterium NEAU-GS5]